MYARDQWIFFFLALVMIALAIVYVVRPRLRSGRGAPNPYLALSLLPGFLSYLAEPKPAKLALFVSAFSALGAMLAALVEERRARTGN
jgi:hypothetical protein